MEIVSKRDLQATNYFMMERGTNYSLGITIIEEEDLFIFVASFDHRIPVLRIFKNILKEGVERGVIYLSQIIFSEIEDPRYLKSLIIIVNELSKAGKI